MVLQPNRHGSATILLLCIALLLGGCADDDPFFEDGGPGPCTVENCSGCCLAGACEPGDDPSACGSGGLACVACAGDDRCIEGQCLLEPSACNAQSCPDGCCLEGKCLPGKVDEACGSGGQTCMACGSTSNCSDQRCLCAVDRCPGCCDQGICRAGNDANFCGTGGEACTRCSSDDFCGDGECIPLAGCSAANCAGCCDGDTCRLGLADESCGKGGESCRPCTGDSLCSAGTCNDPSLCGPGNCRGCCDESACLIGTAETQCGRDGGLCTACTEAQVCNATSGACELDPTRTWGLTVISARIDTTKEWDLVFATAPDPFVRVTIANFEGETRTEQDSYEPTWNEEIGTVAAGVLLALPLEIEVRDADAVGSDLIGACQVTVDANVLLAGRGSVEGCGADGHVLELKLGFTPH